MKIKLAVIGDPIAHSLSPQIHKPALVAACEEWSYEKIRVEKGGLGEFLKSKAARELCGFNLTMPHKLDIIPFLDEIDEDAKMFGAVNTVKVSNGRLKGFNTDGIGCSRAVMEHGRSFCGSRITVLGAGGAASTAAFRAAAEGATSVTVLNRSEAPLRALHDKISERCGFEINTGGMTSEEIGAACEKCDILINGTPLGMEGVSAQFDNLSFVKRLGGSALVFDMIYKPHETELLKTARKVGLETMNGFDMLAFQGFAADEIFLEKKLDFSALKEKIEF